MATFLPSATCTQPKVTPDQCKQTRTRCCLVHCSATMSRQALALGMLSANADWKNACASRVEAALIIPVMMNTVSPEHLPRTWHKQISTPSNYTPNKVNVIFLPTLQMKELRYWALNAALCLFGPVTKPLCP